MREASSLGRPLQPIVLCAYEVDSEPIFDALVREQRMAYGVNDDVLRCPNWRAEMLSGAIPSSQVLAERLIADGYVGLRVQSFASRAGKDDLNMVFWDWGERQPSRVVPIDDDGRMRRLRNPVP